MPRKKGNKGGSSRAGRGGGYGNRGRGGGRGGRGGDGSGLTENFRGQIQRTDETSRSFSMQDEARNTERHIFGSESFLRNKAISFVAAGTLNPEELLKPYMPQEKNLTNEAQGEDQALPSDRGGDFGSGSSVDSFGENVAARLKVEKLNLESKCDKIEITEKLEIGDEFFVDLCGDSELDLNMGKHTVQKRSPSPPEYSSSSSSEEIVFVPKARRNTLPAKALKQAQGVLEDARCPVQIPKITTSPKSVPVSIQTTITTVTGFVLPKSQEKEVVKFSEWNGKRATRGNKRRRRRQKKYKGSDDEAIDDYIKNLTEQQVGETCSGTSLPNLGPKGDWMDESSLTDKDGAASDSDAVERYKNGWSEDDLRDFDDLSTDEGGVGGRITKIMSSRTRPSGLQYLIQWDGYDTDDAVWVLADSLDSSAEPKLKIFNELARMNAAQTDDSSDEKGSEEGEVSDDEVEVDEADQDEDLRLAKLLQRQEDLGLGDVGYSGDVTDLEDELFPVGVRSRKQKQKARQNALDVFADPLTGQFPSASRMADAYEGFDVMDWERPSIATSRTGRKKTSKGKMIAPSLSDSELDAHLANVWQKDRQKKKLRKIEREELRAQGLLGAKAKNTGRPNPSAKYKDGITIAQVYNEIRDFMLAEHSTLALPPMSKGDRKTVHGFAAALKLHSKSIGTGKARFTTLIKNSRSAIYEGNGQAIERIINRPRFLKHMGVKDGGKFNARYSTREGQIVGASAPELSATNKGRLMLEKMGYKTGTSLGIDSNKGIAEPIVAVIKVSKAGLG